MAVSTTPLPKPRRDFPYTHRFTIIAQDPAVRVGGRILTTEIEVPAEQLAPGPCGYRVNVIDYDASSGLLYSPAVHTLRADGTLRDPFAGKANGSLTSNPQFHAQNVYAIVMKTLARFEFALGRRVPWGSDGHQLHVAPHAFADANAFYSKEDRGLFFGYFADQRGQPVFTCLSHDIVAHETTHALLDGLRRRYLEPSSPQQAAFHEGFADIVALLSVFSLKDVVSVLLGRQAGDSAKLIATSKLSAPALKNSVLFGLAEQMGEALSTTRGNGLARAAELTPREALRRSVTLSPSNARSLVEEHDLGEVLVAAMLNTFLAIWLRRLAKLGTVRRGMKDLSMVVDEGARVADHLLTMSIRALDYCPPTDINFSDFLSALLTIDHEVVPDDTKFGYRDALLESFRTYGIRPAAFADKGGVWQRCGADLHYGRTHFDSMVRDKEEIFRFIWENRKALDITEKGYVEVETVFPSHRIGPDGFVLRETIAEYVQILTLRADELKTLGIQKPKGMENWRRLRLFGGGALVFDEYGRLKYQIRNRIENAERQSKRLQYLWENGYFETPTDERSHFARVHLARVGLQGRMEPWRSHPIK
jgi:hypothetical protein